MSDKTLRDLPDMEALEDAGLLSRRVEEGSFADSDPELEGND